MSTISELKKELLTLPLGNIYKKIISGKTYYYHQYFLNGKRYSVLLKNEEVDDLQNKIKRRKEIEKYIKSIKIKDVTLSKAANELTGYVMNKNAVTAKFIKGDLIFINEDIAPLVIKRTHSLEKFLKLRVIDMSRTNARILKKVLNIDVDEDYKASLYSYALSISDHYWFKPLHSKLKYDDIDFNNDALFEASLKGETNVFYHKAKLSPEITTTGSFEKGWRYINNEWYLYKTGNNRQLFSELFCSEFASLIGINTIRYELDSGYIRCKNFSPKYNFEPLASLLDDNEDYDTIFKTLYKIKKNIARDYLKLIFFDSVINNVDRHNENIGLLRDDTNGKILSLAPNFDNNLALIATTETLNSNISKDGFVNFFISFLKNDETARNMFLTIEWKEIKKEDIDKIIEHIPLKIENVDVLASTVLLRYNYLKDIFRN